MTSPSTPAPPGQPAERYRCCDCCDFCNLEHDEPCEGGCNDCVSPLCSVSPNPHAPQPGCPGRDAADGGDQR